MNTNLTNPEITDISSATPTVPQFGQVSPAAMRHLIYELTTVQDELKERLRRQEQATRNAIGVGVLSTVLAMTAVGVTLWATATELRSEAPLAAARQIAPLHSAAPAYPVLASSR